MEVKTILNFYPNTLQEFAYYVWEPLWVESSSTGPRHNHLDRLVSYVALSNYHIGSILYISKTAGGGFLIYTIRMEDDLKKEIRDILNNRAIEFIRYYNLIKGKEIEDPTTQKIINEINATPSTDCEYCEFGGYKNKTKPKGLIQKKVTTPYGIVETEYPNYCNVPLEFRVYGRSIFDPFDPSDLRKKEKPLHYPYETRINLTKNNERVRDFVRLALEITAKNVEDPMVHPTKRTKLYHGELLFDCPRKGYYKNRGEYLKIHTANKHTITSGISSWRYYQEKKILYETLVLPEAGDTF